MPSVLDAQMGIANEVTYNTPVAVNRFYRPATGDGLDYRPNRVQGLNLRPGQVGHQGAMRVTPNGDYGGSFNLEVLSKGYGLLWEKLLGQSVSTLVSGSTYQQNHTLGGPLKPFTLQHAIPQLLPAGDASLKAFTYAGCVAPSWGLAMDTNGILRLKADIDAKSLSSVTALATFAQPAAPLNLFSFAGAAVYSGSFTAPTANALAIGATQVASVTSWSLDVTRNADVADWRMGGKSIPSPGIAAVTGALGLMYDADTFVDAFRADTPFALVLNFEAGALGVGKETVQVVLPEIRMGGSLPKTPNAKPVLSATYEALENGVNPLLMVCCRTADTAL